jgi:uncharacterized protein with HEPN domain
MQLEAKKLLYDIQTACKAIEQFVAGKNLEHYENDLLLQSAVERQFMIIGEALSQLIREWPEFEVKISNAREIVDLRNVIVHGYSTVENQTVWGIIQGDLLVLSKEIDNLIR